MLFLIPIVNTATAYGGPCQRPCRKKHKQPLFWRNREPESAVNVSIKREVLMMIS